MGTMKLTTFAAIYCIIVVSYKSDWPYHQNVLTFTTHFFLYPPGKAKRGLRQNRKQSFQNALMTANRNLVFSLSVQVNQPAPHQIPLPTNYLFLSRIHSQINQKCLL